MTDSNGDIKRQHTPEFKTTVVLALLKEKDTLFGANQTDWTKGN